MPCRLRHAPHVVEDHRRGKPHQHVGILQNLVASHMDLHVPAEFIDALGHRLDHVDPGHGRRWIEDGEAYAANPACLQTLELRIGHVRMENGNSTGVRGHLRYGIQRTAVVGDVIGGRNHHHAGCSEALLQQTVFGYRAAGEVAPLGDGRRLGAPGNGKRSGS